MLLIGKAGHSNDKIMFFKIPKLLSRIKRRKSNNYLRMTFIEANKYFAPDESVKYLYHYTTIEALVNGMIVKYPRKGEEICLWATHNQYMNDPLEFERGISILNKMLDVMKEQYKMDIRIIQENTDTYKANRYFVCFSEHSDCLPMWNMYGANGHGVALKLNRFQQTINDEWILKCEYEFENVRRNFMNFLKEDMQIVIKYLSLLPFIIKHPAYSYEAETRFISAFPYVPTKYRHRNGMIIPYKEILLEKELLDAIIIGPSANQDKVEQSLRLFLNDNNLSHVKIERSSIPYRTKI